MYAIRVDESRKLLRVELSGRLTTDEALRAVSQSITLAEASNIRAVVCDLSQLYRGPGGLLLVSAAIAAGFRPGMRLALVGRKAHLRAAARVLRFSGLRQGTATFEAPDEAERWLGPAMRPPARISQTELRHATTLGLATKNPADAAARRRSTGGTAA
ncbi:MAG: hypothetical protein IT303_13735 [Dehalococcoidia bacterium]|nr:hypothetical protein [Dehalococcoidia bacterium]